MKIIPDTKEEWKNIVDTSVKGGAIITDKLFTGGVFQFLVELGIKNRTRKALEKLKQISVELKEEINKKIDLDYLKTDEFMIFISDTISEALKIKNLEKINYFKSAIISGMIQKDIGKSRKSLFIDALTNLSVESLALLKLIDNMAVSTKFPRFSFGEIHLKSGDEPPLLIAELKALERYNLIDTIRPSGVEDHMNDLVVYTKFAKTFISFITKYAEDNQ